MLHCHVWIQNNGKILSLEWIYHWFGKYERSRDFLSEPQQNNLINPEAY